MIDFLLKYPQKIYIPMLEHLQITVITLGISLIIATFISMVIMHSRLLSQLVVGLFGVVYSIPSMALFAMLIPFLGLGAKTAIFVLIIYNQFILIRNILAGFNSVDSAIIEAAKGMGMSNIQLFYRIRLPLASPIIIAGVKIAVVSTIGIATIAATINAGGLGVLLLDGLRTQNTAKILWGALLASLFAIIANLILAIFEKKAQRIVSGERRIAK